MSEEAHDVGIRLEHYYENQAEDDIAVYPAKGGYLQVPSSLCMGNEEVGVR